MSIKAAAIHFLKMISENEIDAAYDKYISPNFKHHNQYFKGDRHSLLTAMKESAELNPIKTLKVKRALEEGNTVATHSEVSQAPDRVIACVHIFKFENDKVVEMWDLGQILSPDSPNQNGAF